MKKRSKSDRSEIARDSNSEQKVETTIEFPEDGRTLFSINSKISFSRDEFWGKPGRLFSLLALAIVIFGIGVPFIIQLMTVNLNIPPVICLAIILLVSKVINFIGVMSLFYKLAFRKSMLTWGVALFAVLCLILTGTAAFVYLPFLIQLTASSLGISKWLSAVIIFICPIIFVSKGRFENKIYGLLRPNLPIYVIFHKKDRLVYQL